MICLIWLFQEANACVLALSVGVPEASGRYPHAVKGLGATAPAAVGRHARDTCAALAQCSALPPWPMAYGEARLCVRWATTRCKRLLRYSASPLALHLSLALALSTHRSLRHSRPAGTAPFDAHATAHRGRSASRRCRGKVVDAQGVGGVLPKRVRVERLVEKAARGHARAQLHAGQVRAAQLPAGF